MSNLETVKQILGSIGIERIEVINEGQIAMVNGVLANEDCFNQYPSRRNVTSIARFFKKKYIGWATYWKSRGKTPFATVRTSKEMDDNMHTITIGLGFY